MKRVYDKSKIDDHKREQFIAEKLPHYFGVKAVQQQRSVIKGRHPNSLKRENELWHYSRVSDERHRLVKGGKGFWGAIQEITKWLATGQPNLSKKIYSGQYRLKKNYLWIEIPLPYCFMVFECKLFHAKDLFNPTHPEYAYYASAEERLQYNGHFTVLKLLAHYSRPATSSSIFASEDI